jgi:hypothetical protein
MTGPAITVQAEAISLLGIAVPIFLTVQLVDPNQTGGIFVVSTGVLATPKTATSQNPPSATTVTVGPIWGNDVLEDSNDNVGLTYYSVAVYTVAAPYSPIFIGKYQFAGSGTVDILSATPYAPTAPVNNPLVPANEVFAGPTSGSPAAPGYRALVGADILGLAVVPTTPATVNLTTATVVTTRVVDAEPVLNYSGSTSITGSVAAVRGNTTIASGTTITAGYVYGAQGKVTVTGTLGSGASNYSAGLVGQLDMSAAVGITSPLSALWLDAGATASAAIIAAPTEVNMMEITNTTNAIIHSILQVEANASYFADVTDLAYGGTHWIVASAPGTIRNLYLKCLIGGVEYHIPLYN